MQGKLRLFLDMQSKIIFFRNDDVRNKLDDSLQSITSLFIYHKISICHAVEPANVSTEVINWLISEKEKHPDIIEIIQHGYKHKLNYKYYFRGKYRKGEFGGSRGYDEQYDEINRGKNLMEEYFGKKWFTAFSFPYGGKNEAAIRALANSGYKVLNDSVGISKNHKIIYITAHLLRKNFLFGKNISWHLKKRPEGKLFDISASFGPIKTFYDEDVNCEFYSLEEMKQMTQKHLNNLKVVGIVLHHRYHNTEDKLKLLNEYLIWLKGKGSVVFLTQEQIYKKLYK